MRTCIFHSYHVWYSSCKILSGISHWLWGKIVQHRLDQAISESENHRVRKQAKRSLPSGGRRIDFYRNPGKWGGTDLLIPVGSDVVDALLEEYDRPEYTQFGSNSMVKLCDCLYDAINSPLPVAKDGWTIWKRMVQLLPQLTAKSPDWKQLELSARLEYQAPDDQEVDNQSDVESVAQEEDCPDDEPSADTDTEEAEPDDNMDDGN